MPEDGWGWTDVTAMRLADGTDLLARAVFERPDDGNADDDTVMRVPLPHAGAAREDRSRSTSRGRRSCPRSSRAPATRATTTWSASGSRSSASTSRPGCAAAPPADGTATSSTPTPSSTPTTAASRVTFTVPALVRRRRHGTALGGRAGPNGTKRYTYEQADVHDFAWTADPRFIEYVERFSASRDVTAAEYRQVAAQLGRTLDEVRLTDVEVHLLLQPGHEPQARRYLDAAKAGLKYFGLWYGRYPYKTLTVVDPALDAGGSGGMEYPTFITGGTSAPLQPLAVRRASALPRWSPSTSSATSSGTAWSATTSSRRRGSTRASTRTRPAG